MDESLSFRIELLRNSGQASAETIGHVQSLAEKIAVETGIIITEENGAMLVTHFCIALERAARDEPVNALDELVREQICECASYPRAEKLLETWKNEGKIPKIHENEKDFMLMHLCTLLESGAK